MSVIEKSLSVLGKKMRDAVTGFEGVAESVTFDLYGCIQVILRPPVGKNKLDLPEARWFDAKRLRVVSDKPVMAVAEFATEAGVKGGADHPPLPTRPRPATKY